jgi:hypothetical protein
MAEIVTSRWKFEHDRIRGFLSQSRASTDALSALEEWKAGDPRRSYAVVGPDDSDAELVADLTTERSDSHAGDELDAACGRHGIERSKV